MSTAKIEHWSEGIDGVMISATNAAGKTEVVMAASSSEAVESLIDRFTQPYDSTADTLDHIRTVQAFLGQFASDLIERGVVHDDSKLNEPEKEAFDHMTPLLKSLEYGSDEYKASLEELGVALKHHYAANSHHPEHYERGINGMDLLDLVEMYCDWCAAIRRTKDGSMAKSLNHNRKRFSMSNQLVAIFENTAERWGA